MEENCNDIIDENDHNHGVEGAVCDTEVVFFVSLFYATDISASLLFGQGR